MKNTTDFAILSILIILFGVVLSNEVRFMRIEKKLDVFLNSVNNIELPSWEETH